MSQNYNSMLNFSVFPPLVADLLHLNSKSSSKIRTTEPQPKITGSYKKSVLYPYISFKPTII